ncbi:MAG: isoleucine--tRNA ligase [Sporichthyaceae bacterium]|nr:isoleucine--tRNA ligase [Sporichthyaceae bacterium]
MYRLVPAQVDLPALEHEVLAFWRDQAIFQRSIDQSADRPLWVFYEGPPTANGMPGTHHVEARVFKDVFPRYRTMKGYHVPRKGGWDCHGLPVELAVEKELGFSGKGDIEAYGVAEFNARCRESVLRHVDAFAQMTERMGFWVDMSEPYRTMDTPYVESVWWSLKVIFDKGLLVEDHRITPYCPRCGTGLSDHELAQGYETVVDPSVYVRFPLTSGPYADKASLLIWTTTPWTLVSNTAVAVHPDVTYIVATDGTETVVVAEPLFDQVLGDGWTEVARLGGRELEHWRYQRPFELVAFPEGSDANIVVLGEYVTTDDGTGLVHQAPAFGEEDLKVCRAYGLPVVNPVRPDGTFEPDLALVGGQFFKKADEALVRDLERRGLMFRHLEYEHAYPHCWRCHTPLLYYAVPSWYIRTTAVKDALLAENEQTNWYPETIKWGRYGDWLHNNVDWALSRTRYWGTPLPIWRCPDGHLTCVGSLAELSELTGSDQSQLDPHRPYVDAVTFLCPRCKLDGAAAPGDSTATRVPEVIDAWYDSGAMPFAQFGYPYQGTEEFEKQYPAQFICEALDQTRGWFYTLMAVGTLVFEKSSYENVLCLGIIQAEDGRRMSKHLGNILEPIPLMERHGADALRWFMLASGSPWQARRVGHTILQEIVRKVLLTYWNTVAFHTLYARAAGWTPDESPAPPVAQRPLLDRWVLFELNQLVVAVDAALDRYDPTLAGRLLSQFVDDLSNWYVRRSRRRFWSGDPAALATLHTSLETLTRLLAPLVPFISERVWQDLVRPVTPDAPESVHLASWPQADPALADPKLSEQMALVRRLIELGRAARATAAVRTRQPLGQALVGAAGFAELPAELRAQIADELNVVSVAALGEMGSDLVDYSVKANFRALGKRFGSGTQPVAAAIAAADPATVAADLRAHGATTVTVNGDPVSVGADEVVVTESPRAGWAVESGSGETVALDLHVTPELRRAGVAREVVRLVQDARKTAGLDITDRIELTWSAADTATGQDTAAAVREHAELIGAEVLAISMAEAGPAPDAHADGSAELGLSFALRRAESR